MSWTANGIEATEHGVSVESVKDKVSPPYDSCSGEVKEQIEAVVAAADALIKSGAFGTGKTFNVGLSGHANPGHEPTPGWANDGATISVWQKSDDGA